jgi:twinkle protein
VDILRKYEVGATMCAFPADKGGNVEHMCATFPWISVDPVGGRGHVLRVKLRSMSEKGKQRLEPRGGGWGLFGWHTVPHDAREVVITEGEFDAMAAHQVSFFVFIFLFFIYLF